MARQQYNNRQINAYQPNRASIGGYSRYGGTHRNAPPPRFTEEPKPADAIDVRAVIADWIEREMDPWFYSAMRFEISHYMSSHSVSVYMRPKTSMTEGSYYSSAICAIDLKDDRMVVTPIGYNNNHLKSVTILYAEPQLLEMMQHNIKLMYNCTPVR